MQKTDRDRLDTGFFKSLCSGDHTGLVQRRPYRSVGRKAFANLKPVASRNKWFGFAVSEIVKFRKAYATKLQNVAKPFGRDKTSPRTTVFENRVGCHSRCVYNIACVRKIQTILGDKRLYARCNSPSIIIWC